MIDIASTPPSQFGVAGQISHSENPDWFTARDQPAFTAASLVKRL